MKILELVNHIRIPITNEESDILGKFDESEMILKSSLDLREQHVANQLVNKDILLRLKDQSGKLAYKKR